MSQDSAALSLLSLSIAASHAQPIPLNEQAKHPGALSHHRRLSSTGRRRRLSDARDAASRPLSVGSPVSPWPPSPSPPRRLPRPPAVAHAMPASAPAKSSTPIPIAQPAAAAAGARKKRGVDHKCEACSKLAQLPLIHSISVRDPARGCGGSYGLISSPSTATPSCLIKHRWEHTPHWRTLSSLPHPGPGGSAGAGTGVLSKHAQVQLLEAAAILSHLSPDSETGTSLPEDRGMWPRWVSGGALEGEDDVPGSVPASVSSAYGYPSSVGGGGYSVGGGSEYGSASASAYGLRSGSAGAGAGPRLHDYEVPRGAEVAQRAGVVEVPNARAQSHSHYTRHGHAHSGSVGAGSVGGGGAWSVPRSVSVSASVSSEQSRSRSTPSDDEEEEDDEDQGAGRGRAGARVWRREEEFDLGLRGVKEEGEEEYDEYGDEFDDGKEKEQPTNIFIYHGLLHSPVSSRLAAFLSLGFPAFVVGIPPHIHLLFIATHHHHATLLIPRPRQCSS
ncbi:hypothetical protein B0H14DRAFT_3452386 [Mycena olivaceomarginata]|nr:hypothetical protein B0H14DRAFT_3452386 [Mycena olivaceomarginata]